eukprot:1187423-Prorocentrum_minimum.AAC.5
MSPVARFHPPPFFVANSNGIDRAALPAMPDSLRPDSPTSTNEQMNVWPRHGGMTPANLQISRTEFSRER